MNGNWDVSAAVDRHARACGSHVRKERKKCGLTIEALAENVGIDPKHMGAVELAKKRPSFELICHIAEFFKVSPGDLFDWDDARVDRFKAKLAEALRE